MQIDKGEDYTKLRPVYFVGILNFSNSKGLSYVYKHLTIEEETGENVLNGIKYAFIQLTKFKKKESELVTPTDKWTYFIKNAENLKVIPSFVDEEGLMTAFHEADKHNWKKEELIAYDNASIRIQDARGEKELAHEKGVEEGEIKTVIKPYIKGKKAQEISNFLDIPVERVQQIINEFERNK